MMRICKKGFIACIMLSMYIQFTSGQSEFIYVPVDSVGPESPWGKCFGDLDNDGLTDLIIGGYVSGGLVYYKNPGWEKMVISDQSGFSTDIEVFDIEGDHDLDLFCVRQNTLEWFENPGWNPHLIDSIQCHDLEMADFNGDGKIDLVARNQGEFGCRGDQLFFYEQRSPQSWKKTEISCEDGEGLKVFDLNGDGLDDVIINGFWFENSGSFDHWEEHDFTDTWNYKNTFIDVGDIDGDGRMDIVMSPSELQGMTYHISWFRAPLNPADIWAEFIIHKDVEAVHHFVGLADFNLDGAMDVATAEMLQGEDPDEVKIYYNFESGNAWKKQVISDAGSHSMRILDVDQDGDMDLFGANHNDRKIKLWINQIKNL